ncbi:helix-turn-helix domain-containing protein [Saccharothrix syringae]|nr:helix-turn-helix transcriptional regulator [Saccharothrix syringae]
MDTEKSAEHAAGNSWARLTTARSRELGEELRRIRRQAGLALPRVAKGLGWSAGKLSKLELGSRGTSLWEIGILIGRYGVDKATRDRVLALADQRADIHNFLRLHTPCPDALTVLTLHEANAATVTAYEPFTVPALGQTEDYARALIDDQDQVGARMKRQRVLHAVNGPRVLLYVHEAALHMGLDDPVVMRDQALHLTLMCGWPGVTVRLVPMTTGTRTRLRHPATLMTFPDPIRPVACAETDTATVFHDDPKVVAEYHLKMWRLGVLALGPDESHERLARWADRYDRGSH